MSASSRSMVAILVGFLAACGASAPDDGGGDGDAQPDAGELEEEPDDPDAGTAPATTCQGVASSMGLVGALDTTFGYYREGVNDQYRFGGKAGDELVDVTLWQNKEPFADGTVEPVEFELKTTDEFFDMGIWVLIYPDVEYDGDIADLTGVNPTFAATRARITVTSVDTTSAVATVENASFVEVDYALEPIEGGCTTEIASFSINVPTFVD